MIDLQEELLLRQVVNRPSREDSFLDLIFTNNEDIFGVVDAEDSIMTDHRILSIQTFLETPLVTCTLRALDGFEALNFHHRAVKWDDMTIELAEVDWSGELAQHDVEDMFEAFRRVLLGVCEKHVPRRTMRGNRRSRIPRDRKILMRKRCKLRKKMERELNPIQSSTLKNQLKELELKISKSHEDEMMRVEGEAIDAIRDNSKFFFTYAQSKAKTRTGIGPLSNGTELVQDPLEMSELLRVQYESVFTSPLATRPNNILEHLERETLENFHLELSDFHKAAKTLRNGSSAGPDGIPALLIKKLIGVLAEPFKVIWTESMQTGVIPRILKRGKITPIYKGGDRMIASNYRPVTLTSHCIKMYEKIIVQKMTRYLEDNNLYNSGQHGFRGGRSCLTQLIDHQMNILEQLCDRSDIDVVYLDFAKAFDKVDHGVLMEKLSGLGIRGRLLNWISQFLRDRKQFVAVDGAVSTEFEVISGVPQGSVLGPLLFLVHIADLTDDIQHCKVTSFADDTRVVKAVKNIEDCSLLQDDLDRIYGWAIRTNMFFNGSKFELLRYTVAGEPVDFAYKTADDLPIHEREEVTDLGVVMTNSANFVSQVAEVASRGRQRVGWIFRVFKTRERAPIMTLYRALVLPILEYCCQLWHPQALGLVRQVEAVQRSFTYRINGMEDLDYWQRLERLKLYSLERRRERYLIIYVWKVLEKLVPNFEGRDRIYTVERARRGRLCVLPTRRREAMQRLQTLHEGSIPVFGTKLFNCLPKDIRELDVSLETFKSHLDRFLARIPDKPCLPHYHQGASTNSIIKQLEAMRADGVFIL